MNRFWIGCFSLALIASSARAETAVEIEGLEVQPGGLTADDAVRRSLAASSSAAEKQAEIDVANARIRQTVIQFVPKLGLKASYMRLSSVSSQLGGALLGARNEGPLRLEACDTGQCLVDSEGNPIQASSFSFPTVEDNYVLTANLTIPLSDYLLRLSDASAGAEKSLDAARLGLAAAESKVRTDARVLYYNWLRAHAQSFIAAKAVERSKARVTDARAALDVGRLANSDLLRIEALLANAEMQHKQAEALRQLIGAQLAILMRDPSGGEYRVGSGLPALDAEELPADAVRKLTSEALTQRLELRAIDAATSAIGHGTSAVRAAGWPRVDAVGELVYANPNPRYFPPERAWHGSWAAGLVASFNVDAPFGASAQAAELEAQAAGLRAQRSGMEAAIVNEVVTAHLDVVKAHAALAAGQTSVKAYEEAYRVATDLFNVGRGTTTDLVNAET
ncbi:MAG TPA: TolC family protein, partial [Polyangiales bacterium]|nr:TolC family protein [Polyangiales bacterium]